MKLNLRLDDDLLALAKIFKEHSRTLYIVGGYVRNAIMGFCETDIDICSNAKPEEVFLMLLNSPFSCKLVNRDLGTLHIYNKEGSIEYEHTTFRAEIYAQGGTHSPENVQFVDDIKLDASRRDFSANALYYDILSQEVLDFYDGIQDVQNSILKTVETPDIVFSRDGLRILRMIRISSELNFNIDKDTFVCAKNLVAQLNDISQERFNKEIVAILFADYKYQSVCNPDAVINGVKMLTDLGAWQFVLPRFYNELNDTQKQQINNIEWKLLAVAPPALRIASFTLDLLQSLNFTPTKQTITNILGIYGVMLNKKECERQFKIISAFLKVKNGLSTEKESRLFLQANFEILNELFGLLKIANIGQNLFKLYDLMLLDKVPFSLKELAITGQDLIEIYPELPKIYYSDILNNLLKSCAIYPELNTKDSLLFTVPDELMRVNTK